MKIQKRLMKTVPRGTAGEFIAKQALDDESDCGSCQSRRRKAKHPADMCYRKRKAAMARKKAAELLSQDEEDYEQPGYDDDTDDSTTWDWRWRRGQGGCCVLL